jgi:hypothetical protein
LNLIRQTFAERWERTRINMCGIAGELKVDESHAESGKLRRMIVASSYRGPDANAVNLMGPAGFAHARLSIIDLEGAAARETIFRWACSRINPSPPKAVFIVHRKANAFL